MFFMASPSEVEKKFFLANVDMVYSQGEVFSPREPLILTSERYRGSLIMFFDMAILVLWAKYDMAIQFNNDINKP